MGTQHQNVIEINGKKYDAVTGKMLGGGSSSVKVASTTQSVDGFSKRPTAPTRNAHTKAAHANKQTQKSQTLMRSAVKKPISKGKSPKPTSVASIRKPSLAPPASRTSAAKHTNQSPMISHFGSEDIARSSVVKKVQPLEVKKPVQHSASKTAHHDNHSNNKSTKEKSLANSNVAAAKMIEKALTDSTSHEEKTHTTKKRHRVAKKLGISSRVLAFSSFLLIGVLLGGFFAIQNVPNVSMRVASARAGFDATLPGYSPSGFSYNGPINYGSGQITVSFKSNTNDDREYDIVQRASNWNSDALLSNFVVLSDEQYQTYNDRGRTLYIYGGSNATWVDSGIWYQIEGDSKLTTDQLVRIASSM